MVGLDSNWVLVIITFVYTLITFLLVLETRQSRKQIERQNELEKQELRKTTVVPVQWRIIYHGQGPAPSSAMEIQVENLGPGPAKDIEIRGHRKQGGTALYRYGFFPGLMAGGMRWMTVSDATQGQFKTWNTETWETPPSGLFGGPMTVEVHCRNILNEEMPALRNMILKGDDVRYQS